MRRIASVLSSSSKRPDSTPDDAPSSSSSPARRKSSRRFFGTLNRITVSTERTSTRPLEPAHSSSASSTGSVSLRTPEDDRIGHLAPHGGPSPSRKAWIPWLTPKKTDLQTRSQRPTSFWSDSLSSVPSPTAPPAQSRIVPDHQSTESDDETSDDSSSSESEAPPRPFPAARSDSTNRPFTPIGFLNALTMNSIQPTFSPPPLLHYPNVPIFPRSSNGSRSLPFCDTMESTMHRKRLLHRLQRGHLTTADQRLLATIGRRTPSAAQRRTLVQPEEGERYDLKHVRSSSLGLKQWIARPYFEERCLVSVPDEAGTVVWTTIKGSGFGVWALEVSETIELMAGLTDAEDSLPIGTSAATAPNSSPVHSRKCLTRESAVKSVIINHSICQASLTPMGKIVPYKAEPSPLRGESRPSDPPVSSPSEVMTPAPTAAVSSSRRGVRFAENVDKEDQVPLGYILRHRKRREEKTLFLQREQVRREHEEEKLRHEAERQQWEKEKRQWQKEKRALEETKRQKQYAEVIAAARVRREGFQTSPSSQAKEQDRKPYEAYSRPSYDPRRQVESPSHSGSPHTRNDSRPSSRQGSVRQPENAGPLTSRPVSAPSVISSEDVRTRISRNNGRASVISESSHRPITSPVFPYGWPVVPPMPQMLPMPAFSPVQAVPIMPQFPISMPLLPPTAPFMRQQYDRSRSPDSSSRGVVQSRSAERPPHSADRTSPPSHRRSSSDDYGGRNSTPHPQPQRSSSLAPTRPAYPMHSSSPGPQRASTPSSSHRKPYAARRQTATS
jgi:hypothetical protein